MKAPLQPAKSFGSVSSSATAQRKGLKTITDNRPTAVAQRKLQGVVHQYVCKNNPIQRVILNLDMTDEGIKEDAETAKMRQDRELGREVSVLDETWSSDKRQLIEPLKCIANRNPNEPLVILAHGMPEIGNDESKVGGRTAKELFNELISFGLTKDFVGVIDLSNCTTAWKRGSDKCFAEKLFDILREEGYTNTVTGYGSFVASPDIDTETEISHSQRERGLIEFMLSRYMSHLDIFTNLAPTAEEKAIAARELKNGSLLANQECKKQLFGLHDDTYAKAWLVLARTLESVFPKGVKLSQKEALKAMDIIMDLKTDIGRKGGSINKVPAEKVRFENPVNQNMLMHPPMVMLTEEEY